MAIRSCHFMLWGACESVDTCGGDEGWSILGSWRFHVLRDCGNALKQWLRCDCEATHHSSHCFVTFIDCRNDDALPSPSQPPPLLTFSPPFKWEIELCWNALCLFSLALQWALQYFTPRCPSGCEVRLPKQLLVVDQDQLTSLYTKGSGS